MNPHLKNFGLKGSTRNSAQAQLFFKTCIKDLTSKVQQEFEERLKLWNPNTIRIGLRLMGSFLCRESSPIFAQRIFRSYRVLHLHSRLWKLNLSTGFGRGPGRHGPFPSTPGSTRWLMGFILLSFCDHNKDESKNKLKSHQGGGHNHKNRNKSKIKPTQEDADEESNEVVNEDEMHIKEAELFAHMNDLDFIHELTAATVVCARCSDRLVVYKRLPNVEYCHCPDSAPAKKLDPKHDWVPFLETPDLLIWRKPHPDKNRAGLYVYKVYGYYDDISAADFLATQLDLEYRKEWDNLVSKLRPISVSPFPKRNKGKEEIIHWEMQWPKMFSNRDYCFARRYVVDRPNDVMVIMSRSCDVDGVPEKPGVVRVKEYWSVMHIKATKSLHDPGVEFGLTYYDNPGLSLPGWLINWAGMAAIPDFLNKVREAARRRRKKLLSSHSHVHLEKCEGPYQDDLNSSGVSTSTHSSRQPRKTEILLSQFFKQNFLEEPLTEA